MRARDRAIGITLGILLGLAIVIGFVFLGSEDTIDDPSISGGTATKEKTAPSTSPNPAP